MLRSKVPFIVFPSRVVPLGTVVEDDDPIVKGRESLFERVGNAKPSAEPGEKRTVSRRKV